MTRPDLIIFDLGRVLVDFDFKKVVQRLKRHSSKTEEEIRRFFSTTPLWDAFERGTVAPPDFFNALKKDLELNDLDFQAFAPLWNDIFLEMPETVEILAALRGRYKLAMISNVNQMHWNHVSANHPFMKWFDIAIASYAVGHRKPETEIYQIALRRAGVEPAQAIFIDDVEAHIRAAESLGIRAHQFHNAARLRADLDGVLK